MKKVITFLAILITLTSNAQTQYEYLKINNVDFFWNNEPGSIDTILFEVKPKGIYTEIGMYLDYSTRGVSYSNNDSLEIEMLFKLPPMAEVIDMWLWIGDTIIVADVYDKWTASQIYEDIVDRRTDPAILYKYEYSGWSWFYYQYIDYTDYYMFKIFPLLNSLPRKAKITYLVKNTDGLTTNPSVALPVNIMKLSYQNILKTRIRLFPETGMTAPVIREVPSSQFVYYNNPLIGNYYEAIVNLNTSLSSLTLAYNQPLSHDINLRTHNDADHNENFYQLQIKPSKLFNLPSDKKALFLFDFVPSNCNSLTASQLLSQLKLKILDQFDASDSVNFMFSGFVTHKYSNSWIPADSLSITQAFNTMSSSWFNSYSNLVTLLNDGVQFIRNNNDIGNIILIASSGNNGAYQQANSLLSDLLNNMGPAEIPVYIIDLIDHNAPTHSIGGQYYYGNEYLYTNLSMQTAGDFYSILQVDFNYAINGITEKLSGFLSNFDMYTTLENGYTYSNFDLFAQSGMAYYDQVVQKIGKYYGTGRFRIIAHGQLPNGQLLVADTLIDNSIIMPVDSVIRAMWSAQVIRELSSLSQTNSVVNQIISISKVERVLSDYTAFLALEPGLGNIDPEESNGTTSTEEVEKETTNDFKVYPNPVYNNCFISYRLYSSSKVVIEIFDIFGKKLATLTDDFQQKGEHSIVFDASDLLSGVYVCRIQINNQVVKSIKFVKS